jgi:uridine kinase
MTLVVGIAGATGSGKTTVARRVIESLPRGSVAMLQHDSYYRDRADLSYEQRCELNFDHPDSLETSLMAEHLQQLRAGKAVRVPIYDFTTHRRLVDSQRLEPGPVVVVEGILVLADPELRSMLDIKVFVDTDADIRLIRRIRRDMAVRGRPLEEILDQYLTTVQPMHLQFVEPSKRYADLVIPRGGENTVAIDLLLASISRRLAGSPV